MKYRMATPAPRFKIYKGTPRHDAGDICKTCRYAQVMRGQADSTERTYCSQIDQLVSRIVECSSHDDKSKPSLYDMRQIAWALRTSSSGNAIGFVGPKDRAKYKDLEDFDV